MYFLLYIFKLISGRSHTYTISTHGLVWETVITGSFTWRLKSMSSCSTSGLSPLVFKNFWAGNEWHLVDTFRKCKLQCTLFHCAAVTDFMIGSRWALPNIFLTWSPLSTSHVLFILQDHNFYLADDDCSSHFITILHWLNTTRESTTFIYPYMCHSETGKMLQDLPLREAYMDNLQFLSTLRPLTKMKGKKNKDNMVVTV